MDIPVEMKISGIKKAFPNIKRLGMLYSPNSMAAYRDIAAECAKHGLALDAKEVNSEDEFSPALSAVLSDSDCFLVTLDTKVFFSQTIRLLFLESLKRKVPVIGLSSFFTKAGAAMSFDSDYKDVGRQSGEMASKVLAGEKISAIKPSHPRKYVYSLNLATAEKIGIVFPQNVVREAVEVFK
jgi:putative ABC transport system substrate-binding protein